MGHSELAPPDRPRLPSVRLTPATMYPAGDTRLSVRRAVLRSGLGVRVVECGPRAARPVLCLHGWGASVYGWRYLLPTLADAGYRAIAVDLKGHGLTDRPTTPSEYTTEAMTAFALEIMDVLELERATLVGHSMGALIALETAFSAPERVHALALIGSVGLGSMHLGPLAPLLRPLIPLGPLVVRRWMVAATLSALYGRRGGFAPRDVDEYWAPTQFPGYSRAMVELLQRFRWGWVELGRVATLPMPLLVVRGSRDRLVRLRDPRRLVEQLPNARVLVVDGAGHVVHEEAPVEVHEALLALLRGADGPP